MRKGWLSASAQARDEQARIQAQLSFTRSMSAHYSSEQVQYSLDCHSPHELGSSSSSMANIPPEELGAFDALVDSILKESDVAQHVSDPTGCRRFVETRLYMSLLEAQEDAGDEQEAHIRPFDAQAARRRRYCIEEERRKDAEDEAAAQWQEWCKLHPQNPPPRRLAAARGEVQRQNRRLRRLEAEITKPHLEREAEMRARSAKKAEEPWVRRVQVPWKMRVK